MADNWEANEEIQRFREYLRIPTVQPNVNYGAKRSISSFIENPFKFFFCIPKTDECIQYLRRQAESIGLPITLYYPYDETKPVAVLSWIGQEPDLPSILLNSHMDVVPVFEEYWKHPPFGAEMDETGKIFARGAQDMKSVGIQYLGAINQLKRNGIQLKRTIHVVFVPGETTQH